VLVIELRERGHDETARLISSNIVNKLLVRSVIARILHWGLALCDLSYSSAAGVQDSLSCAETPRNLVGIRRSGYKKHPPS
jgi:hypothetical protein